MFIAKKNSPTPRILGHVKVKEWAEMICAIEGMKWETERKTIPEDAEPLRDPDALRAERRERAQGAAAGDTGSRHQTVCGRTESFLSTCPGKIGKF